MQGRGGEEWGAQLASALESCLNPLQSTGGDESLKLLVIDTCFKSLQAVCLQAVGYGVDLKMLNIITGKSCWNLYIDALVLNDDGNVLDALSLACYAALANTRVPKVDIIAGENGEEPELELDDDMENSVSLEMHNIPIIASVVKVGMTL